MDNFKWKSEFNVGQLQIDREHQNLFAIARKSLTVNTALNDDSKKELLKVVVKELYTYTATHFANEENFMQKINYPNLSEHIKLHSELLLYLNSIVQEFNTSDSPTIQEKIIEFIDRYFINHIIQEDKRIALFQVPLNELKKNTGWKDIYLVGDSTIDKEHRKLFELAQEAFLHVRDDKKTNKIKHIVQELYAYMKTHFAHEEEYMKKINYPNLSEQENMHQDIIGKMNTFLKQLSKSSPLLLEKELALIIEDSLVRHIIKEDKKIVDWHKVNNNN